MAIWQYRAWIVPSKRVTTGKEIARRILDEEDTDVWANIEPGWIEVVAQALSLPPTKSWTPAIHLWGAQDGTNLSESVENGRVNAVSCSIDVPSLTASLIERLSAAVKSLDAVLVDADGNCVAPEPMEIFAAIRDSRAARFVDDPEAFLDALSRKPKA